MIWNCKLSMILTAIQLNPYHSDKFIWNDIGNIRQDHLGFSLSNYPVYDKISTGKLDIICISNRVQIARGQRQWQREQRKLKRGFKHGFKQRKLAAAAAAGNISLQTLPEQLPWRCYSTSIMAADIATWWRYAQLYYTTLNHYLSQDKFAGCDEQLLTCCVMQQPELFNVILPLHTVYDVWFYMYEHHCYHNSAVNKATLVVPKLQNTVNIYLPRLVDKYLFSC